MIHKRARPACPITSTDVPDLEWIPAVALAGWAVITRDKAIERRPAERDAVFSHRARVFAIASREQLNRWAQLEILMALWRDIERLSAEPGPFIYALTYTTTRRVL